MSDQIQISIKLNGELKKFNVYPMTRLLDLIREDAALKGTKEGCGEGECGACSILMNGELVNSCLIPAIQADGSEVVTIEGIAPGDSLHLIQQAFLEAGGAQCGICTPGMILAVVYLLRKHPKPTEEQIRTGLAGNLCRCTGYMKIFDSVLKAYELCKNAGVKI